MHLSEIIAKRRSIRRFAQGDVPNEAILEMIEAARHAPSAKNQQNWHFVIVKNRALMQKIADAIAAKHEKILAPLIASDPDSAARVRKFRENFTLFFLRAPVAVLVMAEAYLPDIYQEMRAAGIPEADIARARDKRPGMQIVGAAVQNFMLKAVELGYGTCWLTSPNYAIGEVGAVLRENGFAKEGFELAAVMPLGIPEPDAKSPPKKAIEEICTFFE